MTVAELISALANLNLTANVKMLDCETGKLLDVVKIRNRLENDTQTIVLDYAEF